MLIIVEGPNGVGKSELIKKLLERPYFKDRGYTSMTGSDSDPQTYAWYKSLEGKNIIMDRGPFSEIVYSKIHGRGEPRISRVEANQLNCHYVLLEPRSAMALETIMYNRDQYFDREFTERDVSAWREIRPFVDKDLIFTATWKDDLVEEVAYWLEDLEAWNDINPLREI